MIYCPIPINEKDLPNWLHVFPLHYVAESAITLEMVDYLEKIFGVNGKNWDIVKNMQISGEIRGMVTVTPYYILGFIKKENYFLARLIVPEARGAKYELR